MSCSPEAAENLRETIRAWVRVHGRADSVAEAESVAEEVRSLCGQVVLEETIGAMSGKSTYRGASVGCSCGKRARFVSYRNRWIKTLAGEAQLLRAYYHCALCRRGQAPWDAEQGLNGLVWTARTKALVSQACARLPYREAVGLLGEAGVIRLEESSAEEIVLEVGSRLRAVEETEEQRVRKSVEAVLACRLQVVDEVPEEAKVEPVRPVCGERLYVTLDAAKAHIDGDWHDVKVGAVYTARPDAEGIDTLLDRTYVASQRHSDAFGWQLRTRAALWSQAAYPQTVVVADGADYNWKVAEAHFTGAVQVLDFYHAAEHIWKLSRDLYRQDDLSERALGDRRAREMVTSLKEEGPARLMRSLKRRKPKSAAGREALRQARGYFAKNLHRMDYAGFRKRGLMIGSGPVEAGCKVIVGQRMKQAGMRWSSDGADSILAIRTALLSNENARIQRCAMAA